MIELQVEVLGDELRDELAERRRLLGQLEDGRVSRCNGANLYPLCKLPDTLEKRNVKMELTKGEMSRNVGIIEGRDDKDDALGLRNHFGAHGEEVEVEVGRLRLHPQSEFLSSLRVNLRR